MDEWYHVTPLFLLGSVLRTGGLRSGSDLDSSQSPRRQSSREDDDQPLASLNEARPADCVMLFTKATPPLLRNKMESRGGRWKAFPHVVIHFSSARCLKTAGGTVFGSTENVGRTLRSGGTPDIRSYTSYTALRRSGVQEVMIPAASLPDRTLPIAAATQVCCFSNVDQQIAARLAAAFRIDLAVTLKSKQRYAEAQAESPGSEYIEMTASYCDALLDCNEQRCDELLLVLSRRCFD